MTIRVFSLRKHVQGHGGDIKVSLLKEIEEVLEDIEVFTLKSLMDIVTDIAEVSAASPQPHAQFL